MNKRLLFVLFISSLLSSCSSLKQFGEIQEHKLRKAEVIPQEKLLGVFDLNTTYSNLHGLTTFKTGVDWDIGKDRYGVEYVKGGSGCFDKDDLDDRLIVTVKGYSDFSIAKHLFFGFFVETTSKDGYFNTFLNPQIEVSRCGVYGDYYSFRIASENQGKYETQFVLRNFIKDWGEMTFNYRTATGKEPDPEMFLLIGGSGCFEDKEVDERRIVTVREQALYSAIVYFYKMNTPIDVQVVKTNNNESMKIQAVGDSKVDMELAYCVRKGFNRLPDLLISARLKG